MTRFDHVKHILDLAVGTKPVHGHRAFWRGTTRDQFVSLQVFGSIPLLTVGDGAGSNLVRALKGEPPFGRDSGNAGSAYRRMPAGMPPVPPDQIAFIERWISDGCPDDAMPAATESTARGDDLHNAYWREFDRWAMYDVDNTPAISTAINAFMPATGPWFAWASGSGAEGPWGAAVTRLSPAVRLLAARQAETVRNFYGNPPVVDSLLESYERFGAGTLAMDNQRPDDPQHQMNGESMWFIWSAFADAALRLGIEPSYWELQLRAILIGLLNDGAVRGRFRVRGFPAGPAVQPAIRDHVAALSAAELLPESRRRSADAGI